jgi:hypothetical protein
MSSSNRKSRWSLDQTFFGSGQSGRIGWEFLDSGRVRKTACLILDLRMPGMDELFFRFSDSQNASRFSMEIRELRVASSALPCCFLCK